MAIMNRFPSRGGNGDFKADGSMPMTGDLDLACHSLVNASTVRFLYGGGADDAELGVIGSDGYIGIGRRLNGSLTPVGFWGIAEPTDSNDAANKGYVDEQIASHVQPIAKGGTGATTAAAARTALGAAPLASPVFSGTPKAPASSTSYTTFQLRNIALLSSTPSSLSNGTVALIYA